MIGKITIDEMNILLDEYYINHLGKPGCRCKQCVIAGVSKNKKNKNV